MLSSQIAATITGSCLIISVLLLPCFLSFFPFCLSACLCLCLFFCSASCTTKLESSWIGFIMWIDVEGLMYQWILLLWEFCCFLLGDQLCVCVCRRFGKFGSVFGFLGYFVWGKARVLETDHGYSFWMSVLDSVAAEWWGQCLVATTTGVSPYRRWTSTRGPVSLMSAVRGSILQTTLLQLEIQDPIFRARLMSVSLFLSEHLVRSFVLFLLRLSPLFSSPSWIGRLHASQIAAGSHGNNNPLLGLLLFSDPYSLFSWVPPQQKAWWVLPQWILLGVELWLEETLSKGYYHWKSLVEDCVHSCHFVACIIYLEVKKEPLGLDLYSRRRRQPCTTASTTSECNTFQQQQLQWSWQWDCIYFTEFKEKAKGISSSRCGSCHESQTAMSSTTSAAEPESTAPAAAASAAAARYFTLPEPPCDR